MRDRFALVAFAFASSTIMGCAHGTSDTGDGAGDSVDASSAGDDSGSQTTYDASPITADAGSDTGPAADDAGTTSDGGSDGGSSPGTGGDGGCTGSADCSALSGKPGVSGVACSNGACVITCDANHYDVNGDPSDGCEVADACAVQTGSTTINPACGPSSSDPIDDHTQANAAFVGSFPCDDGSSQQHIAAIIPSDDRPHNPMADNFDVVTGSAPDYFKISATGGTFCQDDANLDIQMSAPVAHKGCYQLHLLTDKNGGQSCTTDSNGHCSITNGSGSYSDGSTIYVWVLKSPSCTAAQFPDDAPYVITGHL
jgi:hypothetical protein